ncbi:MAG: hypothetical protein D6752_06985 [Candidatus Nitrosothermus koennekii]|nr:MAG: hypothetical protein D6752_06985 [Candidatus Nitrosothermus koennekii]
MTDKNSRLGTIFFATLLVITIPLFTMNDNAYAVSVDCNGHTIERGNFDLDPDIEVKIDGNLYNNNATITLDGKIYTVMIVSSFGTTNGTVANDFIVGTDSSDIIYGYKGDDFIVGLGENDYIYGDYLTGSNDPDNLTGGDDIICGNDGDDTLSGDHIMGKKVRIILLEEMI